MLRRDHILSVLGVTVVALALASCKSNYKIDGVIGSFGYEGRELSLVEFISLHNIKVDSCVVSHGHFQMQGKTDSTRLVFLCKDGQPIIPVYLEKGHSKIEIYPSYRNVHGTRQNNLFYSFLEEKIAIDNRYDELSQKRLSLMLSGGDSSLNQLIQDSIRVIVNECENLICSFMDANYSEPAAVGVFMMLSASFSQDQTSLLKRILDAAPDDFLKQSYVRSYIERTGYTR